MTNQYSEQSEIYAEDLLRVEGMDISTLRFKRYNWRHRDERNRKARLHGKETGYKAQKRFRINNPERVKEIVKLSALRTDFKEKQKKWILRNKRHLSEYNKQYRNSSNGIELRYKNAKKLVEEIVKKYNLQTKSELMTVYRYRRALNQWAKAVKERDKVCQSCSSNKDLIAHHILHKFFFPLLSLNLNNGITLCKGCHHEAHGQKYIREKIESKSLNKVVVGSWQ